MPAWVRLQTRKHQALIDHSVLKIRNRQDRLGTGLQRHRSREQTNMTAIAKTHGASARRGRLHRLCRRLGAHRVRTLRPACPLVMLLLCCRKKGGEVSGPMCVPRHNTREPPTVTPMHAASPRKCHHTAFCILHNMPLGVLTARIAPGRRCAAVERCQRRWSASCLEVATDGRWVVNQVRRRVNYSWRFDVL